MGKNQQVTDYFMKVMHMCKDLDPNMPDGLKQTWLMKGLPLPLRDVVFFTEGVRMPQLEERLKRQEEFLALTRDLPPKVPKETPAKGDPTEGHDGQMRK